MKRIAVLGNFLEPSHHALIDSTAARCGFAADYYPASRVPAEKAGQYEVVYGMPKPADLKTFTGLKWFCGNFAGVDAYLDDALYPSPDVVLSNSSGAYGVTIAEHLIMVTLMLLRHADTYVRHADAHRWGPVVPMRSIIGSTITVLGTGDIGTEFARRAQAFRPACITGVRRTVRSSDPAFTSIHAIAELDSVLPETDILVMALPSTAETVGILSRERIALLPDSAFVVNVGRGTAIDQEALCDALNAGQLAGAALDVVVPEPLPADHPLRRAKNLLLTPHVAGNMTLGYTCDKSVQMFCDDLENYAAGRPLAHLVDRKRGY